MPRNYYDVLGVAPDASAEELQQAYRRLARRLHPDVNRHPCAEEQFKEVNDAYRTLGDPLARARYDRVGPDFRQLPEGYLPPWGFHRERAGPGGRGPGEHPTADEWILYDSGIDLDDLLGDVFGGRGPAGPIPGADQEVELVLAVEDLYHGGRRRVVLDGRAFDVTIPPGVTEGQRIRLAGQGGHGRGAAPRGDLYLVVSVAAHPRFRLTGRDIYLTLPVTPWEAALGASVPVPTPGGQAHVQVPPGSSTGLRLRLRGQGLPNSRGQPGDLYAQLALAMPAVLHGRERDLIEELRRVSTFDPRSAG